ncbi:MAG: biotin carboxylase N-terminal domain-containing protein [Alphaproteobacteria bacterium]|nr:biotin carboxylase N-terminal domain-containing protein [Alphaproteobacteria bacterium]
MFDKILIANRGESACRVGATCRRLGLPAATVHSSAERAALHVRLIGESIEIGGPAASQSYLDGEAIIAAARAVGAEAIHPGIGFLSEDAGFARAVEAAGLVFIGPTPETLERFADKRAAKAEAREAGIPTLDGGADGSAEVAEVAAIVRGQELPVLLKAAAGGGGRGLRIVTTLDDLEQEIESAIREANGAFGRGDLMVERYLDQARHIEVQIAGDGSGRVIHLFERECSLQRRYQKVVEEAPAPDLEPGMRQAITAAACALGERAAYRGVGTVEFLVAGFDWYFLEVNPRLQVEHPVTEAVTGIDLVELQLALAAGQELPLEQDDVDCRGHAIEARIYAEDVAAGFAPAAGQVRAIDLPTQGVRVDLGVGTGDRVTPHYDPMIAKLTAFGADRREALAGLQAALADSHILGVANNLRFLRALLARPEVAAGGVANTFIDQHLEALAVACEPPPLAFALAAWFGLAAWRRGPESDPWRAPAMTGWRLSKGSSTPTRKPLLEVRIGAESREIAFSAPDDDGRLIVRVGEDELSLGVTAEGEGRHRVWVDDTVIIVRAALDGALVYLDGPLGAITAEVGSALPESAGGRAAGAGRVVAPVMGQVVKVNVKVGDSVSAGDILIVQESMKMELRVAAPCDGVVSVLSCAEGDMIERHSPVAEIQATEL